MSLEKEAEQFLKAGQKCLKKGLFKWSVDHDGASHNFNSAANKYEALFKYNEAADAYFRAAASYQKAGNDKGAGQALRHGAECLENANGSPMEIYEKFYAAAQVFREMGDVSTASSLLTKAAKAIEKENPDRAGEVHLEVCKYSQQSEYVYPFVDAVKPAINFFTGAKNITQALKVTRLMWDGLKNEKKPHQLYKILLTRAILFLYAGDLVAAKKEYDGTMGIDGYVSSKECEAVELLVRGFEQFNQADVDKAMGMATIRFLEANIVKLAKALNVDEPTSAEIAHSAATDLPADALSSSGVMALEDFLGEQGMAEARGEVPTAGGGGGGGGNGSGDEEEKNKEETLDDYCQPHLEHMTASIECIGIELTHQVVRRQVPGQCSSPTRAV